jgi:hypothetical protein
MIILSPVPFFHSSLIVAWLHPHHLIWFSWVHHPSVFFWGQVHIYGCRNCWPVTLVTLIRFDISSISIFQTNFSGSMFDLGDVKVKDASWWIVMELMRNVGVTGLASCKNEDPNIGRPHVHPRFPPQPILARWWCTDPFIIFTTQSAFAHDRQPCACIQPWGSSSAFAPMASG